MVTASALGGSESRQIMQRSGGSFDSSEEDDIVGVGRLVELGV